MRRTHVKRLAGWTAAGVIALLIGLTLSGRSVGDRPLPWHLAWLAAFGEKGWTKGFELSARRGSSKQEIRRALGDPRLVMFRGVLYRPGEIDLDAWRGSEMWFYPSPFSKYGIGPGIAFEKGKVKER